MKQVISRDQWLELTDKQQEKALAWLKGRFENAFTIGMMIEFLHENNNDKAVQRLSCYSHTVMQGDYEWQEYSDLEGLCDDLWKDVREILKPKRHSF